MTYSCSPPTPEKEGQKGKKEEKKKRKKWGGGCELREDWAIETKMQIKRKKKKQVTFMRMMISVSYVYVKQFPFW